MVYSSPGVNKKYTMSKSLDVPERDTIKDVMQSVVQVVALRKQFLGNMSAAWTGSGTIIDPDGIILTNCHVANPRAMGMPSPPADVLGIAVTQRSDEPPAVTYFAEIVAQSPELDLAVLQIVSGLDGHPVQNLTLPAVAIGDSDNLELGDTLSIFGYPGIGGETVTFTSGSVSGFSKQEGVSSRRAWIKSDATIAGGNSGGTAVDSSGKLVGIPTQAAAGTGITPVDARPVVDTNLDGRVDQRDTPMAIGGFINGLRPVNLAKPLLEKVGAGTGTSRKATRSRTTTPKPKKSSTAPKKAVPAPATTRGPVFSQLLFAQRVTQDGRPINPGSILPGGIKSLFATFDFEGMRNRTAWSVTWAHNEKVIVNEAMKWTDGPRGRKVIQLGSKRGLANGVYHLVVTVRKEVLMEGDITIGRQADDTDTEVSGEVMDNRSRRGIPDALVIALKPGVSARAFVRKQDQDMAYTSARTSRGGRFTFPQQLPKGQAYSLVVVARGYQDLAIESALRIGAHAPEQANLGAIGMNRD